MSETGTGLAETIAKVKEELLDPRYRLADPDPLFFIEQVEIELAVKISKDAKAGINIQVLEVGGSGSKENAQTIKVTLSSLFSKEDILDQMPDESRERLRRKLGKALARGSEETIGLDDL